jgi:hypothetical protein
MKTLKLFLTIPVMVLTALTMMMVAFPSPALAMSPARWFGAAFVLVAGAHLCELMLRPKPSEWTPERQLEHARLIVSEDARWMAHSPLVSELTERYLSALSPNWFRQHFESVSDLRKRLGLCPHARRADPACDVPPPGWFCTRAKGHEGPCAAIPTREGGEDGKP